MKREKLLTVQEVAEWLRRPVSWVYERTRPGRRGERLPHIRLGKFILFEESALLEFLAGHRQTGEAKSGPRRRTVVLEVPDTPRAGGRR